MEILAAHYQNFTQRKSSIYHAQTSHNHAVFVVLYFAPSYSFILSKEDLSEDCTRLSHIDRPVQSDYIYRWTVDCA